MIPELSPLPCYLVNNVTISSIEQCKFVIDNDCLEDEAFIDYVYYVYCEFGFELRYMAIALLALLVIVLFLALSAVADEFLCPSLLAVAKNLRMSDSLAGVTLLAFGNGCPDIFSSLAAASGDRSELIVGELLGAGVFCTSIVSGLIFIHVDFKMACRPILRDTCFYLLAVYLIWIYCLDERITFYKSLAFILIYVIYLIVALSGQAINSRLRGIYAIEEVQQESEIEKGSEIENWFEIREDSMRRRNVARGMKKKASFDANSFVQDAKDSSSETRIYTMSDTIPEHLQSYSTYRLETSGCYINGTFSPNEKSSQASGEKCPNVQANGQCLSQEVLKLESQSLIKRSKGLTLEEFDDFLNVVSPIDFDSWNETGFLKRVISIVRAPLLFAAIMTIPLVDAEKKYSNWCRILNSIHCLTVPLTFYWSTGIGSLDSFGITGLSVPIAVIGPSSILAIVIFLSTSNQKAPGYHSALAYVGFMMSIVWVYTLATEIISLLKTVGIIFSMTDTAIGLGILAWGNSIGDIVANISLAQAGYPRMALGASIGAPLLNLLLGFGLAFTLSLQPEEFSSIKYSPTITLLCVTLATILIALMLSTLVSPERSRKPFGYLLIAGYGVYFAFAVIIEYDLIKF